MAGGPRSQQLCWSTTIAAGVPFTGYTSPGGVTTLVKEWRVNHVGSPGAAFYVYIIKGAELMTVQSYLTVPPNVPQIERGASLVLEPGDAFGVVSTADAATSFIASGMVLQGT